MTDRLTGKYVGVVVDNDDPKGLSRLKARVPEVFLDEATGWCLPCSPLAGAGIGLAAVPPVGSRVFVEWPAGDTSRMPIWSGGSWADGDGVPEAGPETLLLVTSSGHRIALKDASGSEAVEVEAASGAILVLDSEGVTVEFGSQSIRITRSKVSINGGALEVT